MHKWRPFRMCPPAARTHPACLPMSLPGQPVLTGMTMHTVCVTVCSAWHVHLHVGAVLLACYCNMNTILNNRQDEHIVCSVFVCLTHSCPYWQLSSTLSKHGNEVDECTQGLQVQAMTRECSAEGQAGQGQPAGLLKHVLGVQNLGMGLSSKSQQATLCTGSLHILHGDNMYSFMRCVVCTVHIVSFSLAFLVIFRYVV